MGGDGVSDLSSPVVVEAYINNEGEVYDYRIVSGPNDDETRAEVENLLLFSVFEPARFFGQPVRGLAVLSFSGVSVRGKSSFQLLASRQLLHAGLPYL